LDFFQISSLENKTELNNKRADSADQIFAKILEKINAIDDYIFKYVTKPMSLPKKTTISWKVSPFSLLEEYD